MKKMKTSVAIAVALATGVGTSAFAQLTKQDIITVNLTATSQESVSQTTGINAGDWFQVDPVSHLYGGPKYYKTSVPVKITQKSILQYIAYVQHGNAYFFTSKANLVLVQGELSGFFNITPDLAGSVADITTFPFGKTNTVPGLSGTFSTSDGPAFDADANTQIANSSDSTFLTLANGRHFLLNPDADDSAAAQNPVPATDVTAFNPVGHMQPWGQIYVQDPGQPGYSVDAPYCENVTYFFALSVAECYDCFYMNSFISQATFKTVLNATAGPPCCNAGSTVQGTGKDSYYLSLSFDNTQNNPYLYPNTAADPNANATEATSSYVGVAGITYNPATKIGIPGDAIAPDAIKYQSPIESGISKDLPFEARFTLNGILTYTWKLAYINKPTATTGDVSPDFLGTATYAASGYGFIGLFCTLLSGSATFTESAVKVACCNGTENDAGAWFGSWYGVGAEYVTTNNGTTGYDTAYDVGLGSNPELTPFNTSVSLTYHYNFDFVYPSGAASGATFPSGWPNPSVVIAPFALGSYLNAPDVTGVGTPVLLVPTGL